ncbi:MAG: AMP-binding protein, partial [Anaerolineales bacterium]
LAFEELYRDDPAPPADVAGTAPFVVISTAATEGVPRGAVLTHQNLITAGYELLTTLGLSSQDRYLAVLPLFHITGLGFALGALQAGGASVVMGKYDPAAAAALIDEHAVTYFGDFPPILQTMLDARAASGATWSSLRHVFGLDAPDVIQRLQAETEAVFWTGFGQSETSGGITLMPAMERPGSAGRPFPSVRLRCVDAAGNDAPTGEPGEIVVQGPVVFAGYWRDPDATAFAFRRGWHHTGDVGKLDEDGYLYYVGRKPEKELIKSGGENVYPAEVEHALEALPQVAAACVIGVPDEKYGEAVKAVVALTPGASMTAAEVGAAVSERIASYKKPRYVDFVEQLPRRDNGEIDRAAVKDAHG